jgi:signal transduction histidine kinase
MMRDSSYMPGPSDSEFADDNPAGGLDYRSGSSRLASSLCTDEPYRLFDALSWDMADCVPVRVALLDTRLRIRALNAEWRDQDLSQGGELGRDFVQACLCRASQPDRDIVREGLSGLQGRNFADFSATIGLRTDFISRNFSLRARKLPRTSDVIVVALLDVTDKRRLADERRRMMRLVLDAEEAERKRIARELHDETVQQLAAMQLGLAGLREFGRDADFDGRCRDMEDVLRSVQKELRTLSYILHPPEIDGGLVEALGSFVHGFARRTQLNARFVDETSGLRTDEEMDRALYRVAQEALINVCKHAEARQACVYLRERDGQLLLGVEDDGVGIAADLCTSRSDARLGVGLSAMRERIEALAGQLEVSRLEQGTRVLAILPSPRLYQ